MKLWSEESEQSLLGAILTSPERIDEAEGISVSDFYVSSHRELWKALLGMVTSGQDIDVITVAEKGFDLAYLGEMAQHSTGNIKAHARIIREKAVERSLMEASNAITAAVMLPQPLQDKIEAAQKAVMDIGDKAQRKHPKSTSELLESVIDDMTDTMNGLKRVEASGIDCLDKMVKLMVPGALNVVAARPSMGKTAFALTVSDAYAQKGKTALIFSQEMKGESLMQRLMAAKGRIPLQKIINAEMYEEEMERLQTAIVKLKDSKLFIDEQTSLTVAQIRTKCRQVKRKAGLDLVVVDYLQLMSGSSEIRHEEIAEISRGLKKLAMDMNIPVIALSQLNRGLESRTDKRPQMADLRESGQIEQDADTILMLYRDEVYNPDSPMKGICEIICRKNRQGSLGHIYMTFIGDFCHFEPFYGELPKAEVREIKGGKKWG